MAEIEASRDNGNDYNSKDLFVDAELEGAFLSLEENWRMEMGLRFLFPSTWMNDDSLYIFLINRIQTIFFRL